MVFRRPLFLLLLACALLMNACGVEAPAEIDATGAGGASPVGVVEFFFNDLDKALKDPSLVDLDVRNRWAAQLADYFAPDERQDQRELLDQMFSSFARDLKQLDSNQSLTITVRYDSVVIKQGDDKQALVQVVNGNIYMLIQTGQAINYEDTIQLGSIIGRTDDTIPTVKVGPRWYLTDQY